MFARLAITVLITLLCAQPAQARWRMAESENFVIYADDSASDLERFSNVLERYHLAMEVLTGREAAAPSPSARLTVYVVGSQRDIRRLARGGSAIAGFYSPRASGSTAFVQDVRLTSGEPDFSMIVLLHEYAHHFSMSASRYAMPLWVSEGSAEFFASARFAANGEVEIGRPALHRTGDLFAADRVPIRELLDTELYTANRGGGYDGFYGQSWLLYHYLSFAPARRDQLRAYFTALREGLAAIPAAERAFGDLGQLDEELEEYLEEPRMPMLKFPPDALAPGAAEVRELSDGMNEALPLIIQSRRGVTPEMALELLPEMRAVAGRYPADPGVLAALAEAEFDAGNDAEAIAAADQAIARDPNAVNAYVQKGYALFRQAGEAKDAAAAYDAAMRPFTALNRIEPDHPLPLIHYYQSFVLRHAEPPELARHAIERASEMAPFDQQIALTAALSLAQEGKVALASSFAIPLATDPHGGELAEVAKQFRAALTGAVEGKPFFWEPPAAQEQPSPPSD